MWKGFENKIFFRDLLPDNGDLTSKGNAASIFFTSIAIFSSIIKFYVKKYVISKKKVTKSDQRFKSYPVLKFFVFTIYT